MTIKFVIDPNSLYKNREITRSLRIAESDDIVVLPPGFSEANFIVPPGIIIQGDKKKIDHESCDCCKEVKIQPQLLTSEERVEKLMTEIEGHDFAWRISKRPYKNVTDLIEMIEKDDAFIDFTDVLCEKPSYLVYATLARMRKIANKKQPEHVLNRLDKALVAYAHAIIVVRPAKLPTQLVSILQSAPNAYWSRIMAKYIKTKYYRLDEKPVECISIEEDSQAFNEKILHEKRLREIAEGQSLSSTKQLHFDEGFCDMKAVETFTATIWIGQRNAKTGKLVQYEVIHEVCRRYCDEVGLCVTVTPTRFMYTDGREPGAMVGLMNYPLKLQPPHREIKRKALVLAYKLMRACNQKRVSVVFPDETVMLTNDEEYQEEVLHATSFKRP